MKFEILREELLRPLLQVTGVVERRQTLAVLSNVLIGVEGESIRVAGTDLEVELKATLSLARPCEQAGETTIPARKLAEIWRSLPDDATVSVVKDGDRATIRSGRSRFQLATLPATEFPVIDHGEAEVELTVSAAKLKHMLDHTSFAMAQSDVRYFLNGMLFDIEGGKLRTVATDGHRLAMCTSEDGVGGISTVDGFQAIVPRKGVLELGRLLVDGEEEVSLGFGANYLRATIGAYTLTTKLIDGRFPDYQKVVPKGGDKEILGDRDELRRAFTRAAILSNEKYRGVRLNFNAETLTIQANNPDQEEAEEVVGIEYGGGPLEIGFNVNYLQDVLGVLSSKRVRMTALDENSSALIEPEEGGDALFVVMPMRL